MLVYLIHWCSSVVCSQFVFDLFPVRGEHAGGKLLQGLHRFKDHLRDLSSGLMASDAQQSAVTDETVPEPAPNLQEILEDRHSDFELGENGRGTGIRRILSMLCRMQTLSALMLNGRGSKRH